jgi:hypothetical protein
LDQQTSSKSSPNPKAKKEKLELLASFFCKAITPHINQFPAAGGAGVLRKNYAFLDTKAKRAKDSQQFYSVLPALEEQKF